MDRTTVIVLILSFVALLAWRPLVDKMYPPDPKKVEELKRKARQAKLAAEGKTDTNNVSTNASSVVGTNAASPASPVVSINTNTPSPSAPTTPVVPTQTSAEEKLITLETELTEYTFTSIGGGIKRAALKNYPLYVCPKEGQDTNAVVTMNAPSDIPIGTLRIEGAIDHTTPFTLTKTNNTVYAEKSYANGFRVVKEFTPSTNYLIDVTLRLENLTTNTPMNLSEYEFSTGSSVPMNAADKGMYMYLCWYDGDDETWIQDRWFQNYAVGCFVPRPRDTYATGIGIGAQDGVHWSAVMNQFFTVVTIPEKPAPLLYATRRGQDYTKHFAGEKFKDIGYKYAIESRFGYTTNTLIPGVKPAVVHNYQIYVGPKEYKTFEKLGIQMENEVDAVMDFGGFFGFFARALLRSMNGLHGWGLSYAMSIIVITIIIKLLFWPLTNASTKSMKRMSALQPQMKEIQEKYKDNPQKMNQKMMEFMKENKVNPLGGCLPMLLQLPVFFGFFTMLRSAVELRGESFLWVCDLAAPDTVAHIAGFPINILPILMGVTMFWQSSLTPPSPGMDPAQQRILKYMPMMFVFFLYTFSSALTLYWTVQNILTIIQTKITKISDAKKEGAKNPGGGSPAAGGKGGRKKGKKNRPNSI